MSDPPENAPPSVPVQFQTEEEGPGLVLTAAQARVLGVEPGQSYRVEVVDESTITLSPIEPPVSE